MTVFVDINAALTARLEILAGSPPVAWENEDYTPVLDTLYIRPAHLPGDVSQATLGDTGTDLNIGVYQIDVFAPANQGRNAGLVVADNIANHFKRGTVLTYNSRVVRIVTAQMKPSIFEGDWFKQSVEIIYRSYTQPRA